MAGGTWTSQNKILPGVYINVKSRENVYASVGTRGTVAICEPLSWGKTGEVQTYIPGETEAKDVIGYDIASDKALFLREILMGTDVTTGPNKVLIYRPAGTEGAKASVNIGSLTATALYEGVRGNDISVSITAAVDGGNFAVSTIVDGTVVDKQTITALSQLTDNAWIAFTASGTDITASAGVSLAGGVDPTVSAADYAAFLTAIEPYQFDVLIYDGTDATTISAVAAFCERVSNNLGQKCQAVMAGANAAACNSEFVIAVNNGLVLSDGTTLTPQQATWWVGGAEAGAMYYQSLTYAKHPGAVEASPKLTEAQAITAVKAGYICFIDNFGSVKVCTDINTLTTYTVDKGKEFAKNRVLRVLMQFCNDTYEYFSNSFIGKIDNNEDGRNLLKGWIVGYLNEMQANNGIQNFDAEDVTVLAGQSIDAVLVNAAIQPVDAVEKIYMSVTVTANEG